MKPAIALLTLIGLLASVAGCLVVACELAPAPDNCCPPTSAIARCPLDLLSSAKIVAHVPPAIPMASSTEPARSIDSTGQPPEPQFTAVRDLNIVNRVLRI